MAFYFDRFENRIPPEPLPHSPARELLYQYLATVSLVVGAWYLWWRWTESLNLEALWFAVPLVLAETLAFFGLILFTINLWRTEDYLLRPPPASIRDCVDDPDTPDRPVVVDVYFTTYNEEVDLVQMGVRDAKAMRYPHPIDLQIHVLDDGRRPEMRAMTEAESVGYITRDNNIGFKAGNLRNAMENSAGDFIIICDADTRPMATMLERCLGYFRDPNVAWVQTPQWFYDLPEGTPLAEALERKLGAVGCWIGRAVTAVYGPVQMGEDPFLNDPEMFYQVILRRRNWANASFCCGAGSIHRREAVMQAALGAYADTVLRRVEADAEGVRRLTGERSLEWDVQGALMAGAVAEEEFTPYKFHVSEDIYTSIELHSDPVRNWRSVLHPWVECKMLSPQDLLSWTVQRFKYAGGSLDILFHDNPLFRGSMTVWQRVMYGATFWSYLGAIWNVVFLAAPIIYLTTGIAPVAAYTTDFYIHILPFLIMNELSSMVGTWGIPAYRSKLWYISFFPINLRALWTVARGEKIKFPVTPKTRQSGNFARLVMPQIALVGITLAALLFGLVSWMLGREGYTAGGIVANGFWAANNIVAMGGIIAAAYWKPDEPDEPETPGMAVTST